MESMFRLERDGSVEIQPPRGTWNVTQRELDAMRFSREYRGHVVEYELSRTVSPPPPVAVCYWVANANGEGGTWVEYRRRARDSALVIDALHYGRTRTAFKMFDIWHTVAFKPFPVQARATDEVLQPLRIPVTVGGEFR